MTRSGSGWPDVYRWAAMWSTSSTSASSSIDVPGLGVLQQQLPHRVGDLLPPAVADRHVELRPGRSDRARRGRREPVGHPRGSRSSAPTTRSRHGSAGSAQLVDDVVDDLEQRVELVGRAVEVVGGQQEQRDDLDAGLLAPAQQVGDLGRTDPVAVVDVDESRVARPAPVAVEHERDVARAGRRRPAHGPACARTPSRAGRARPRPAAYAAPRTFRTGAPAPTAMNVRTGDEPAPRPGRPRVP